MRPNENHHKQNSIVGTRHTNERVLTRTEQEMIFFSHHLLIPNLHDFFSSTQKNVFAYV